MLNLYTVPTRGIGGELEISGTRRIIWKSHRDPSHFIDLSNKLSHEFGEIWSLGIQALLLVAEATLGLHRLLLTRFWRRSVRDAAADAAWSGMGALRGALRQGRVGLAPDVVKPRRAK